MEQFIQEDLPEGYILINGRVMSEGTRIAYNRINGTINQWLKERGYCPIQYLNGRHNIMQAALLERD